MLRRGGDICAHTWTGSTQGCCDRIVEQMKKAEGVTEQLKAADQMEWVGRMNSIRSRAEEVVFSELVYC